MDPREPGADRDIYLLADLETIFKLLIIKRVKGGVLCLGPPVLVELPTSSRIAYAEQTESFIIFHFAKR